MRGSTAYECDFTGELTTAQHNNHRVFIFYDYFNAGLVRSKLPTALSLTVGTPESAAGATEFVPCVVRQRAQQLPLLPVQYTLERLENGEGHGIKGWAGGGGGGEER